MNFSQASSHFAMYEEKVFQYRKNYLDTIFEKYCNTDEPDYVIDIQTLKIVGSSENVKRIPEFGKLSGYNCKPAQKLINEMLKLYPRSPKKLFKKNNKKERKHVSFQSKRRNICPRLKKKKKRHVSLELDTSADSKSLTCSETCVDLTKNTFLFEDIPIDPCSFKNNSSKKLKHNNNTLSLDKTNFCKSGISSYRIAVENRKQIKSEPYLKHKNNAYSPHLSKGACKAENSLYAYDSNSLVKENKGDRKYVKLIECSSSSQKKKNNHAKHLGINMPLKDTNEAENNFIHLPESNTFEECMEGMKHKKHINEFCLTHQKKGAQDNGISSDMNHSYLNSKINIPRCKKLEFVSQLNVNCSTSHNDTTDLIVESSFKGENSSLSLTSSSSFSKEYSTDSMSFELKNKSTIPCEFKRLKNKQSDNQDVASKQIVTRAACHTVKFTADSICSSQKIKVSRDYSDEFSVNNQCVKTHDCQVSCIKLDCSQYEISREGSYMLNSVEMPCSDKPLPKRVNGAKNSFSSVLSKCFFKYGHLGNQSALLSSKRTHDKLFTDVNLSNPNSNNDSSICKKINTGTKLKNRKVFYPGEILYINGMHSSKRAILQKDFVNCHKKRRSESKTSSFFILPRDFKTVTLKKKRFKTKIEANVCMNNL